MKKYEVEFTAYEVTETDGYTSNHVAYFDTSVAALYCAELQKGYRDVKKVTILKSWTVYETFDEYNPKTKQQKTRRINLKINTRRTRIVRRE